MSTPIFSIVVLVRDFPHLFSVTLESILAQTCKEFEIIVIKGNIKKEIEEGYRDQIECVKNVEISSLSYLMNQGLEVAKGRYIQFFLPGDYFLSVHVLEEIRKKMDQMQADIVYGNYLEREGEIPPYVQVFPFCKKQLMTGQIPTRYQSCWFSVTMLKNFHGYNQKYQFRPNFDLFCKVFKAKNYKVVEVRQVLIDFVVRKKTAAEFLHRAYETYQIILTHFGFFASIRWFFAQDLTTFCKIAYRNIKGAFWRS